MELNQVIYVESLLLCLTILIILFIANLRYWRPIIINRLSLMYIFVAITIILYIGWSFVDGNVSLVWLNKLLTVASSITMTLACFFYYYHVLRRVGLEFNNAKFWYISSFFAIIGSAALFVISIWTGTAFYIDASGHYQKGVLYFGDLIASYAYIACGVIFALVKAYRSELLSDRHRFLTLGLCTVPGVFFGVLDVALPYPNVLPTLFFGTIISMLILFASSSAGRMTRDSLTGLLNRFAFDSSLNRASKKKGSGSLWLFVVDINRFKAINDSFGHSVGDVVLVKLAGTLENVCEQYKATAGRWGGDEFVVFCEFNDDETAYRLVDNLKEKVLTECNDDERFVVSISVGAAKLREFENLKHLFDEADHMLYEDKAKFHKLHANDISKAKD